MATLACSTSALAYSNVKSSKIEAESSADQSLPEQSSSSGVVEGDPIVVIGERRPLDSIPDETLSEEEIAAYGANSVSELIDEIAAERGRDAEEVVFLVNGKRVSGLGDIASYPSETVDNIEIYPDGSAAEVGGNGNQQVVNIRLKKTARVFVARAGVGAATDGGITEFDGEANFTTITAPRRANISLRWRNNDALLESERNILQTSEASEDLGQFRSLRPESEQVELRGSFSDQLSPDITAFLTARASQRNTTAFLGIGEDDSRLDQRNELTTGNAALQLTGQFGGWLVSVNTSYGITRSETRTDRWMGAPDGDIWPRPTRATIQRLSSDLNVTKGLFDLPAGTVNVTVRGRLSRDMIDATGGDFTQSLSQIGGGIFVPLARRGEGPLGALGDINASVDASFSDYSDVGSIANAIYSLQWQPTDWLRVSGSLSEGESPPSVELLAAPILLTPGTRYLDPLTGQSVDVLATSGGNPALASQRNDDRRVAVDIRPRRSILTAITADYRSSANRDIIAAFPPANSLLISAFPERFVRNDANRLIEVDTRPVNFARKSEEQLRYGFELTLPLNETPEGISSSRLNFLFSHTIQLENEILIAPGVGPVDLLSRDAFGFGGNEQSRHEINGTLRYSERGLGVRIAARHRSAGFINLIGGADTSSLRFSPLTTFDLRTFIEGQRLFPSSRFFKGSRLTLSVNNLTNAKQDVRDDRGNTPIAYQPAYRDPTGRLVRLEVRKTF